MANFFSNTTGLHNVLDALQTKAAPTVHTSVCNAFPVATSHTFTPPEGYYYSQVNVAGDSNLTANNIRKGVTVFGVEGALDSGTDLSLVQDFYYSVDPIEGAQYGFELGEDGFYESQNKGVQNSYSICRINLEVINSCSITLEIISYGEFNFDYIVLSKLDSPLTLTNDVDSNRYRDFKSLSSSKIYTVKYDNISAGSHYIDVKFRKDVSVDSYNDSGKFRVVESSSSLNQDMMARLAQIDPDFKPENIRNGARILGIDGTYGPQLDKIDEIFNRTISGSYSNENLTSLPTAAFAFCEKLTSVYFPMVSSIGSLAFYSCLGLSSASFPKCTYIGSSAFYGARLSYANFQQCTSIGGSAFGWAYIKSFQLPQLQYMGAGGLSGNSMPSIQLHNLQSLPNYGLAYCYSLGTVSLGNCSYIGNYAFYYCYRLSQIYLLKNSVCSLSNISAFYSTPFMGYSNNFSGTPVIYVPSSLVSAYKTATNWSYFSNYFASYVSQ